jgi:hypothetical protein
MNLPVQYRRSAGGNLGTSTLEVVRARALAKIQGDEMLSPEQRAMAIRELDFLIEYERFRRLRTAVYQWRDERREWLLSHISRQHEVLNRLAIARKETALTVARMNREIIMYKLEILQELRKLRPQNELDSYIRKARTDLVKLHLQRRHAKARRRILSQSITEQVLDRAEFLRKVRDKYPDLEEELMDDYDKREFQHTGRQ